MSIEFDSSKIIFIGGAPRSGTTLVQRIVASNSSVFGGPEFDLLPAVIRLRNMFHASIDLGRISVYLDHADVDEIFRGLVVVAFQKTMEANPGKQYLSEKTPANVEVFAELAETFPNAKLIFVVRDPRSIVTSMLEVGTRFRKEGYSPLDYMRNARRAIRYINKLWGAAAQVIGKENTHVVFYEDIVSQPDVLISELANKLGLVFENGMVKIENQQTITSEFKNAEHLWYSKENLQRAIDNLSVEKWKDQLTAYELFVIDKRLRRIPEITDRYEQKQPTNLLFWIMDFFGNALLETREMLGEIGRKIYYRM